MVSVEFGAAASASRQNSSTQPEALVGSVAMACPNHARLVHLSLLTISSISQAKISLSASPPPGGDRALSLAQGVATEPPLASPPIRVAIA